MTIETRWYQTEAVDSIFNFFASGKKGNPLVALPTGTGKSIVIGLFIQKVLQYWPSQRILLATHIKELIEQNVNKIRDIWPLAPVGINSSGLRQRDTVQPIICAGIKSIYDKVAQLGRRDILLIDEAHLLAPSQDSMYKVAIAALKQLNPHLIIVGLTATAYRMGQGMLTEGDIFTDICYDLTDIAGFNRLIAEGYLCHLLPKQTETQIDVSSVGINNGDFAKGELERAVDKESLNYRILEESCRLGANRQSWLLFATGIDHCVHMSDMLNREFGIAATFVHSKLEDKERDRRIKAFKDGEYRCIVNVNMLTIGFDHPPIDLIIHARPTLSPGLWVQMNGRGTRPSLPTGKLNCLALDFAKNTLRLGPINDPKKPRKKGEGTGDAPVRVCPECGVYNAASARQCFNCGCEFEFKTKLQSEASSIELIRTDTPIIETYEIDKVFYHYHLSKKDNAKPCMRIQYIAKGGMQDFTDWVFLDHPGFAGHKARDWWRERHGYEPPTPETCAPFKSATEAALSICGQLRVPKRISVWVNRPNPAVQRVEYE